MVYGKLLPGYAVFLSFRSPPVQTLGNVIFSFPIDAISQQNQAAKLRGTSAHSRVIPSDSSDTRLQISVVAMLERPGRL